MLDKKFINFDYFCSRINCGSIELLKRTRFKMKHLSGSSKVYHDFLNHIKNKKDDPNITALVKDINDKHKTGVFEESIYEFILKNIDSILLKNLPAYINSCLKVGIEIHHRQGTILWLSAPYPVLFDYFSQKLKIKARDIQDHPLKLAPKDSLLYQNLILDINKYSGDGDTIYTYAARANDLSLMQEMYASDPDLTKLDIPDNKGMTPWLHAIITGNETMIHFLEEQGVNQAVSTHDKEDISHLLFKSKNHDFVQMAWTSNAYGIKARLAQKFQPLMRRPIYFLIAHGRVTWLDEWLESQRIKPENLAEMAVESQRLDMLILLHEKYAYPIEHLLSSCLAINIANWLKDHHASFYYSAEDNSPCIFNAVNRRNTEMIEWFLQNHEWHLNIFYGDKDRSYSIITYLMEYGYFDLIQKYDLLKDKSLFFSERNFLQDLQILTNYLDDPAIDNTANLYSFIDYLQEKLKLHFPSKFPFFGFSIKSHKLINLLLDVGILKFNSLINDGIVDGTPVWMVTENYIFFRVMEDKHIDEHFFPTDSSRVYFGTNTPFSIEESYSARMHKSAKGWLSYIQQRDINQQNILCRLVKYDEAALLRIQWLIENTSINLNDLDEQQGSLLHHAAKAGAMAVARWIFEHKSPVSNKTLIQEDRINLQAQLKTPEKYYAIDLALLNEHDALAAYLWNKMSEGSKKDYLCGKIRLGQTTILDILEKNDCYGWVPAPKTRTKFTPELEIWLKRVHKTSQPIEENTVISTESASCAAIITTQADTNLQVSTAIAEDVPRIDFENLLNIIKMDKYYQFKHIKSLSKSVPEIHEQLDRLEPHQKFELFATTLDTGSYRILNQMLRVNTFENFLTDISAGSDYIELMLGYIIKRENHKAMCIFLKYDSILNGLNTKPVAFYNLVCLAFEKRHTSMLNLLLTHPKLKEVVDEVIIRNHDYILTKVAQYGYSDILMHLSQLPRVDLTIFDNQILRDFARHEDCDICQFLLSQPSVITKMRANHFALINGLDASNDAFLIELITNMPEFSDYYQPKISMFPAPLMPMYPAPIMPMFPAPLMPMPPAPLLLTLPVSAELIDKELTFAVVNGDLFILSTHLQRCGHVRTDTIKKLAHLALITQQFRVLTWLIESDHQEIIKRDKLFCLILLKHSINNKYPIQEIKYLLDIYSLSGLGNYPNEGLIWTIIKNHAQFALETLLSRGMECVSFSRALKKSLTHFFSHNNLEQYMHLLQPQEKRSSIVPDNIQSLQRPSRARGLFQQETKDAEATNLAGPHQGY